MINLQEGLVWQVNHSEAHNYNCVGKEICTRLRFPLISHVCFSLRGVRICGCSLYE